jgi:hypothetical protein
MIWLGGGLPIVLFGVALTGLGYSLVYPSFGVEAPRRAPPEHRALAMGAYSVYLDASLGLTGPLLGFVAAGAGVTAYFW